MFMQDTLIGAVADEIKERLDAKWGAGRDASFNPFSFYKDVKDQYPDMELWLQNGHFDSVQSPDQWVAKAEAIRRELGRAPSSRTGAARADPGDRPVVRRRHFLVPVIGPIAKGGAVAKAGVFAATPRRSSARRRWPFTISRTRGPGTRPSP
jgi:hypothetical protein